MVGRSQSPSARLLFSLVGLLFLSFTKMSSLGLSTDDDGLPSVDIPDYSKREYLLAQIRQKDAIIESLLKQVRV